MTTSSLQLSVTLQGVAGIDAHLVEPSPLMCACVCSRAVPIQGEEGQQQVGHELAHIESDGPIHGKLGVYGIGCVLSHHEAPCVHVTMQQSLSPLHELGLQPRKLLRVHRHCCMPFECSMSALLFLQVHLCSIVLGSCCIACCSRRCANLGGHWGLPR